MVEPAGLIVPENVPAVPIPKPAAKGAQEGIKVHGHWIIEVKNPDGSSAARQEFDNAIDSNTGADVLTGLLSGEYVSGGFFIALNGNSGLCGMGSLGFAAGCLLFDTRSYSAGNCGPQNTFIPCGTITYAPVPAPPSNTPATGYTLSGSVQNVPSGTISNVTTGMTVCMAVPPAGVVQPSASNTVSFLGGTPATSLWTPSSCGTNTNVVSPFLEPMTSHSISQPVTGGQTVAVTVAITFS